MQMLWVYEHEVDWDGLRRFHREFGYGLAGRLIEPSPLPFGRHRWVAATGPALPLHVEAEPRPRSALSDWADDRAQQPIDPEFGPGWHMAVLPMTDGSTGVTLVGSHCLGDGGAALMTVFDAVRGHRRDLGYPPPRARYRRHALIADARQTVRDAPQLARTVVAAAGFLARRRNTGPTGATAGRRAVVGAGDSVIVPAVSAMVDLGEWDRRAAELSGNSHSLLAGLAARLAVRQGRAPTSDGDVALIVPINARTLEDTRANAVTLAHVRVDPSRAVDDLSDTRAAIREALRVMREGADDDPLQLLPLTPFIPKRAVRGTADLAFAFGAQPVSCSNVGDLPVEIASPDGTPAEQVMLRGIDQHITRGVLEQRHGLLTVVSGRVDGKVTITVVAYQPGSINTKDHLRRRVTASLGDLGLSGVVV